MAKQGENAFANDPVLKSRPEFETEANYQPGRWLIVASSLCYSGLQCNPGLFNNSSAVAQMGDRDRAKWAEKWGELLCPFASGSWVPISHLTHCRLG